MRLTAPEIQAFIEVLTPRVGNFHAQLFLYGSRVHDEKRGGDIDLLLEVKDAVMAKQLNEIKYILLADFKERIGDQKIDFLICTPDEKQTEPFLQLISRDALVLHSW